VGAPNLKSPSSFITFFMYGHHRLPTATLRRFSECEE
jgi:hypothetical protein